MQRFAFESPVHAAVSYTHLDVYKRQVLWLALPLAVAGLVLMLFLRETRLATTVDGSGHGADEGADDPRRRQGARRR